MMTSPTPISRRKTIVVQKYGGSSLADAAALKAVAKGIAQRVKEGTQLVVVVSAMGGSTDALIALAAQISEHPKRRELDMLLSTGERVTMALLSMAIADCGVEAISFTGSQCGIITNDRHADARIIDVRPVRVEDELARGRVVIVAGFQGMSYKREITTLGRGGSDTTALALAAALHADSCEIYSDVEGVFSADPRLVNEAHLLDTMTYGSLESLARNGAKVLHADAVAWARRAGIQFSARKTGSSAKGTLVSAAKHSGVQAVTSSDKRLWVAASTLTQSPIQALVWASHEGVLVNSENLHEEAYGEACSTLSIVGEGLLDNAGLSEAFIDLCAPVLGWWSSDYGLHVRLTADRDLKALTRRVHAALVEP
jgi:aspartate kinase